MAFTRLFGVTLRLHFRNKMALLYGHLFPAIVLLAFLGLYSHERQPLLRHLGELLTITALSAACFGLPTTLVGERERGIWRHYRLAPVPLRVLVLPTLLARFCLVLLAGVTQVVIALAVGIPLPAHPLQLAAAFSVTAFAFIGLGLVLSMLADTVNAAQAVGQCVFLPMLIVGGVAVPIGVMPDWAQRMSAYLPGRYAVEAIQACVTGGGLGTVGFQLLALLGTGLASVAVGMNMFRWAVGELKVPRDAKAKAAGAFATWVVIGFIANSYGPYARAGAAPGPAPAVDPGSIAALAGGPDQGPVFDGLPRDTTSGEPSRPAGDSSGAPRDSTEVPLQAAGPETPTSGIDGEIDYSTLPPDDGLVAPIAREGELPPPEVSDQLECMRMMIPGWGPGRVPDPTQRVRNILYVAAVPDMYQTGDLEKWVPLLVEERLQREFGKEELAQILYRIATNPEEGDMSAAGLLNGVCFERAAPSDRVQLRERVTFYALKLLGRTTGRRRVKSEE